MAEQDTYDSKPGETVLSGAVSPLSCNSGDSIFQAIEANCTSLRHDRGTQFRRAAQIFEQEGNDEHRAQMQWEAMAFWIEPRRCDEGLFRGKRFAPRATWTDQSGRSFRQPDEIDFTDAAIAYYEMRARSTANPIHRARYCDLLWESRRKHEFGRLAFEAYQAVVPLYLENDWGIELTDACERALTLALQLNDRAMVRRAVAAHFDTFSALKATEGYRWFLELLRSLLNSRVKINDLVDWGVVAGLADEAATHFAAGNGLLERQFLEALADVYRHRGQTVMSVQSRARIGESFERNAAVQRASEGGALGAVTLLQCALQTYVDLGQFPDRVEALKNEIKSAAIDARQNAKRIAVPVNVPIELLESISQLLEPLPLETALQWLATWNGWIPSYAGAKAQAEENADRFPLSNLATVQVMRNDNPALQIDSDAAKIEYHAIQQIVNTYAFFAQTILARTFELLSSKGLTADAVLEQLAHSNVFTPERLQLLGRGIERYFAGDYVSALHILPVQVEGIIRDIAASIAIPSTSRARTGGLQERQLEDLLAEDAIKTALGDNFVKFVSVFLIDQRGTNLRHEMAHALLPPDAFERWLCDLIIMVLLYLSRFRLNPS